MKIISKSNNWDILINTNNKEKELEYRNGLAVAYGIQLKRKGTEKTDNEYKINRRTWILFLSRYIDTKEELIELLDKYEPCQERGINAIPGVINEDKELAFKDGMIVGLNFDKSVKHIEQMGDYNFFVQFNEESTNGKRRASWAQVDIEGRKPSFTNIHVIVSDKVDATFIPFTNSVCIVKTKQKNSDESSTSRLYDINSGTYVTDSFKTITPIKEGKGNAIFEDVLYDSSNNPLYKKGELMTVEGIINEKGNFISPLFIPSLGTSFDLTKTTYQSTKEKIRRDIEKRNINQQPAPFSKIITKKA